MQEKLIIIRLDKKIKIKDMAELLSITIQQYSRKEKGINQFTANEMFMISDYFGKKIEEIFLPVIHQNGVKYENKWIKSRSIQSTN